MKKKHLFILITILLVFYGKFLIYDKLTLHGDREKNVIYLTFDDGPNEKTTPQILDILKQENVSATFFIYGAMAEKYPELLKRVSSEGHELAVHSFDHGVHFINAYQDIEKTKNLIENITGKKIKYFRPAYGVPTPGLIGAARDLDLKIIMWDVFPKDYSTSKEKTINYVMKKTKNGSIIVLHDGGGDREQTIKAIPEIIMALKEKGFDFHILEI